MKWGVGIYWREQKFKVARSKTQSRLGLLLFKSADSDGCSYIWKGTFFLNPFLTATVTRLCFPSLDV